MKLYHWLLALVLVSSSQVACAQEYSYDYSNDACTEECCGNGFFGSVYGEFLWWKVCRTEMDFNPSDTIYYLKPDYDSGYRVGGKVGCKCIDLGLRYTSYSTQETRKNPEATEQDERIRFRFDYDVVDLEAGFNFNVDCACGTIRPFAGVKFADIDEKYDKEEFNGEVFKQDFRGTGLYVGAEGKFRVYTWEKCDCSWNIPISFALRASTGILDGKYGVSVLGTTENKKDECLFIPVNELFVGAEFGLSGCFSCVNPVLRLGYEVQSWGWREWLSEDDVASLGLGGMVLGLEADF